MGDNRVKKIPAEVGGHKEDVSPKLNIVLTTATKLHLLTPDSDHLLFKEFLLKVFPKDVKSC